MGFNTTATTTTLTAKLTPIGRQQLVSNNTSLISGFSLGDSDANYYASEALTTGEVPSEGGSISSTSGTTNSTPTNVTIRSSLVVNSSGALVKAVEPQSSEISTELVPLGATTISGSNLNYNVINRYNNDTDPLVNLYYSFGLSLTPTQDIKYTATTTTNGGYANTALSGLAQSNILVIGINNSVYGELLDGKTIKLSLPTTAGTYTIYSTFQYQGINLALQDTNLTETSLTTRFLGDNIALLFSDGIMRPNGGDPTLSWSTGYGTIKPFSINQKQLYNLITNTNLSQTADTAVGIAYLDKGFLVITNPTIVNAYQSSGSTGTTLSFDSVSTSVSQNITCIANRGEFGGSTNSTFGPNDVPRISEVGLYDSFNNLIAIAKTDRHLLKNVNQFLAIGVKISL